ncbi:hypothetical protein ACFQNE_01925 [Gordonia phosphorivorans]|uniref:Uncharacterized protein n=1 Tax=Gordonia phosphorivorans TaxID=1056982 RepID=A0ABV6H7D2_9ACTN
MTGNRTRSTTTGVECVRCHQPVRWWRTAGDPGSWVCVDFSPDDTGTVQKLPRQWTDPTSGTKHQVCRILHNSADWAAAVADSDLLFTLHTRTCSALPADPTA